MTLTSSPSFDLFRALSHRLPAPLIRVAAILFCLLVWAGIAGLIF